MRQHRADPRQGMAESVIHCEERKTNKHKPPKQQKSPLPTPNPPWQLHFVPGTVGVTRASSFAIPEDIVKDLSSLLIFQAEQIKPGFDAAVSRFSIQR